MVVLLGVCATAVCVAGCGSSNEYGLSVGQKLYNNGQEFGIIAELSDSHEFENGVVESGALVDYGARIPSESPHWFPQRSAARMTE